MTSPTTRDELRALLAQAVWDAMDERCTDPCFSQNNQDYLVGCGCIKDASDAILAALDGAGLPTEALVAVLKGEAVIVPKEPTNRMMALGGPEVRKAARLDPGDGNMQTIWGEFEKEFSVIVKRLVSTERELQALKCRVPKEKSR